MVEDIVKGGVGIGVRLPVLRHEVGQPRVVLVEVVGEGEAERGLALRVAVGSGCWGQEDAAEGDVNDPPVCAECRNHLVTHVAFEAGGEVAQG